MMIVVNNAHLLRQVKKKRGMWGIWFDNNKAKKAYRVRLITTKYSVGTESK